MLRLHGNKYLWYLMLLWNLRNHNSLDIQAKRPISPVEKGTVSHTSGHNKYRPCSELNLGSHRPFYSNTWTPTTGPSPWRKPYRTQWHLTPIPVVVHKWKHTYQTRMGIHIKCVLWHFKVVTHPVWMDTYIACAWQMCMTVNAGMFGDISWLPNMVHVA